MQQQEPALVILTIVLAAGVLALLVWLGQRGNARPGTSEPSARPDPVPAPPTPAPPTSASTAASASAPAGLERVHAALAAGRKIEAIKHYRELTGLGLKESKDAVEALERGAPVAFTPSPTAAAPALDEVTRLARTGQLIQAIKLYRELTGLGLKESKDAVERLRDGS